MINDLLVLQNNIKKENVFQLKIQEKEKFIQNEFNSLIDLFYKYKKK